LFAVSSCTTYHTTLEDDMDTYRTLGIRGMGVWEYKVDPSRAQEQADQFLEKGLVATFCFPNVPGVIYGDALFSEPKDRGRRLELLAEGIGRLALFEPIAVACLAGAPRDQDPDTARGWTVDGLRQAAQVAGEIGIDLAVEVIRPGPGGGFARTIPEAVGLIDDIGLDNVGLLVDFWHIWDQPGVEQEIVTYGDRIIGVQVNDSAPGAKGWFDRALPGEGEMDLDGLLGALGEANYDGWYELELFSDDGTFGNDLGERSLWRLDPEQLLRSGRDAFFEAWEKSKGAG
jgi:sugar phosphate isomerase/epimerase